MCVTVTTAPGRVSSIFALLCRIMPGVMARISTAFRICSTLICVSILVPAQITAANPCLAIEKGKHYEAEQLNTTIKKVFFDDRSLRIDCDNGTFIVSSAPKWDVCIFNTGSKRFYRTTEAKFRSRWVSFPATPMPVMPASSQLSIKHSISKGMNVTTISAKVHEEKIDANEVFFARHDGQKNVVFDQYIYTVADDSYPPQVCHILQDLYRCPVDDRFPLQFLRKVQNSRLFRMALRTNSFKIVSGAVSAQEPVGYTPSKDPESVWFGPGQRQTVESGLTDLFGERKEKGK